MFYPGSSAVILAYDVTRRDTLDTCIARDTELKDIERGSDPPRFLVGCKTDLEDQREVRTL
jgi:GTPase SAR1 family protein